MMLKLTILKFVLLISVLRCTTLKCYNGFSQKDNQLTMSVREQDCLPHYDRCVSLVYTSTIFDGDRAINKTTIQGNCANPELVKGQCAMMGGWYKNFYDCKILSDCTTDFCNKEPKIQEDKERKHAGTGEKMRCYTGQQMTLPGQGIAIQSDECFDVSHRCITVTYTMMIYHMYPFTITQGMCGDPKISSYCDTMDHYMNFWDCKEKSCKGNDCNKEDFTPHHQPRLR